jgi:hypothetical protein
MTSSLGTLHPFPRVLVSNADHGPKAAFRFVSPVNAFKQTSEPGIKSQRNYQCYEHFHTYGCQSNSKHCLYGSQRLSTKGVLLVESIYEQTPPCVYQICNEDKNECLAEHPPQGVALTSGLVH